METRLHTRTQFTSIFLRKYQRNQPLNLKFIKYTFPLFVSGNVCHVIGHVILNVTSYKCATIRNKRAFAVVLKNNLAKTKYVSLLY